MSASPEIDVYYAEICGLCHKTMDYLRARHLPFNAHEVVWGGDAFVDSENTRAMFKRCGGPVDFVPQIFINNRHIAGWRKLEPMIQSGELDRLLASSSSA